ncbi:MAG: energy-dependent translational throttle protein EttA, partial [Candidatus Sericytochromatia bacterium]|nr:energy-dependent translational throttle protein EttA [Candidatus Sericytochromatia bacterium]
NIQHAYIRKAILKNLNLTAHQGDRIGLIGANGAGKSTLLRIMSGLEIPDSGDIRKVKGLRVSYLNQDTDLDPEHTVKQAIDVGVAEARALLDEYEELSHKADATNLARLGDLQHLLDHMDAWELDWEIERVMSHLQTPAADRKIGELSGGERRRVTLCRSLITKPDLLILDEPTNHLDSETIEWLEGYLRDFRGTLLLVTHDRYFLDRVTDRIIELEWGELTAYEGNYSDYLLQKAERMAIQQQAENVRQNTLSRELAWVRKQPQARQAKSKARVEAFKKLADEAPPAFHSDVDLMIPYNQRLGKQILELKKVSKGFGGRSLIQNLELNMMAGERIGVIGPNGVGKTTLMKMILGKEAPDSGSVETGQNTRFLYADQGRDLLNPESTVVAEVAGDSQWVQIGENTISVRSYLKRFLFSDEQSNTPIKRLSGGERNRVQLAKLLREGANFLILDEPTNDLDLPTLRVLEDALVNFPGCALVISHDRYFLNRVATAILAFEGDGVVRYQVGDYDNYLAGREARAAGNGVAKPANAPQVFVPALPPVPARQLTNKENNELKALPAKIETAEQEMAKIEVLMADGSLYTDRADDLPAIVKRMNDAKQQVATLYERWESLEALKTGG